MRSYLILLLLPLLQWNSACSQTRFNKDSVLKDFYHRWNVERVSYLNVSSMDDAEIKRLQKKEIILTEKEASIFDVVYNNPDYTVKKAETDSFLMNEFGIKGTDIELKSKYLFVITVSSRTGDDKVREESEMILTDKNLCYIKDGVVFILKRVADNDRKKAF